jgi:hypothetical protein
VTIHKRRAGWTWPMWLWIGFICAVIVLALAVGYVQVR